MEGILKVSLSVCRLQIRSCPRELRNAQFVITQNYVFVAHLSCMLKLDWHDASLRSDTVCRSQQFAGGLVGQIKEACPHSTGRSRHCILHAQRAPIPSIHNTRGSVSCEVG